MLEEARNNSMTLACFVSTLKKLEDYSSIFPSCLSKNT